MFLRKRLPGPFFAVLALFLFVSVSDAVLCGPCHDSPCHEEEGRSCDSCLFCLSPAIESVDTDVIVEKQMSFLGIAEYGTKYEAPSSLFLRPPRS